MSARDVAISSKARLRTRLLTLVLATLAGAAIGAVVALLSAPLDQPLFEAKVPWAGASPVAAEWPREPLAGESAHLTSGPDGQALTVVAPRAPRARSLAAGLLARREAGVGGLLLTRDTLEVGWRVRMHLAPAPDAGARIQCAALLFARARQLRDLALASPAGWGAPQDPLPDPPAGIAQRLKDVEFAAAQADPPALLSALAAEAREEDDWFAAGVPAPGAPFVRRAALWRAWQEASADAFVERAQRSLDGLPPAALDSARAARELALVRIAVRTPAPFDAMIRSVRPASEPAALPLSAAWRAWVGTGALLGALLSLLAAFIGFAFRGTGTSASLLFVPQRAPGSRASWLHVVAGPNSTAVARAALELSAHALARGDRVMVVDGGPRLRLHERFGREARWGLMECLVADMPIIGLVQYGGRPGFYLLAHGLAGRTEGWAALGQRLDDARPHFGRVILALDSTAPGAVGDSLAGRTLEGWWAEPTDHLPRAALELTGRLGIAFSGIDLSQVPDVSLETLGARAAAIARTLPASPIAEPVTELVLQPAFPAPEPRAPVVLDCDLQVRQRLRFLAWMRRVQSERRRIEARSIH